MTPQQPPRQVDLSQWAEDDEDVREAFPAEEIEEVQEEAAEAVPEGGPEP